MIEHKPLKLQSVVTAIPLGNPYPAFYAYPYPDFIGGIV